MRRFTHFLIILLSLLLLSGVFVTAAGAMYLDRYAVSEPDRELLMCRFSGEPVTLLAYEPEGRADRTGEVHPVKGGVGCPERRSVYVPYNSIPPHLIQAFVAIEDKRFFRHAGVDLLRTAEAGINYLTGKGRSFGASTITQQLIKNVTGRDEYTLDRKFTEMFEALALEKTADKSEIMEAYLNIINLGNGCYGVGAAAEYYFSKTVEELTLGECAALAAITNNPTANEPLRHAENNKKRRELILGQMETQGYITEKERVTAVAVGLTLHPAAPGERGVSSWYADMVIADVIRDLQDRLGYTRETATMLVYAGGLTVYTAMDEGLQAMVEAYYQDTAHFPTGEGGRPQSALILMDPHTGDILAVAGAVGEKRANRIQNYATDTRRPSGSVIKPLSVYAPALESGLITWATVTDDEPVSERGGIPWPKNADGYYRGRTTAGYALAHSLNTVSVRICQQVGLEHAFAFLRDDLGMSSLKPAGENKAHDMTLASLALGQQSGGVTVRELTAGFTALQNGVYHPPVSYHKVVDREGRILLENQSSGRVVLSEETSAIMTQMLRGVVTYGTARSLTLCDTLGVEAAGKTGTTQSNCDRWFVGYTPRLLCGVWMGYDYPTPLDGIENNPCLGVWDEVMTAGEEMYRGAPLVSCFPVPSDVIRVTICRTTGEIPTPGCAEEDQTETGWFTRGTEPTAFCTDHSAGTQSMKQTEPGIPENAAEWPGIDRPEPDRRYPWLNRGWIRSR